MKKTTLNHPFVMADRWALFFCRSFSATRWKKRREPSEKRVGLPLLIWYNGAKSRKGDGTVKTVLIADDEPVMRMDL